jgi:hypothetical protein
MLNEGQKTTEVDCFKVDLGECASSGGGGGVRVGLWDGGGRLRDKERVSRDF